MAGNRLPEAPLFRVVPLGEIEERVVVVLPARSLVPVTCSPQVEFLRWPSS